MLHDQSCERDTALSIYLGLGRGSGCKCASRAWAADPLPEPDWTPIWAIQKTPGQEAAS